MVVAARGSVSSGPTARAVGETTSRSTIANVTTRMDAVFGCVSVKLKVTPIRLWMGRPCGIRAGYRFGGSVRAYPAPTLTHFSS